MYFGDIFIFGLLVPTVQYLFTYRQVFWGVGGKFRLRHIVILSSTRSLCVPFFAFLLTIYSFINQMIINVFSRSRTHYGPRCPDLGPKMNFGVMEEALEFII